MSNSSITLGLRNKKAITECIHVGCSERPPKYLSWKWPDNYKNQCNSIPLNTSVRSVSFSMQDNILLYHLSTYFLFNWLGLLRTPTGFLCTSFCLRRFAFLFNAGKYRSIFFQKARNQVNQFVFCCIPYYNEHFWSRMYKDCDVQVRETEKLKQFQYSLSKWLKNSSHIILKIQQKKKLDRKIDFSILSIFSLRCSKGYTDRDK